MDRANVGDRFLGRAHVGLGDDLQQRRAGPVEIDAAHAVEVFVQRLAGVLFQVGVVDADPLAHVVIQHDLDFPLADDGLGHLAGLIALGQVGVEVVLALEQRGVGNVRVDGEPELDRHRHRAFVEHRQHPGQPQVDGAGLGVGLGTEGGGGAGKDLGLGRQLHVHFQPDDGFPLH